jgi:hypothetical protein
MDSKKAKYIKQIPNSADAYAWLKPITDEAQAGTLQPWSPKVVELLESYGIKTDRLKDVKIQANVSFPTSIKGNAIAVGFRHAKADGSFAEDLFVFEENVGLTSYYHGSQEEALPEYADTHHATIVVSEFLPQLQKEIASLRQEVKDLASTPRVEYISDEQYAHDIKQISDDFNEQVRSFTTAHGNSSAPIAYSRAVQQEASKKRAALMYKKAASDKFYNVASEPIPEIALMINAQANNNRFDVQLLNQSSQALVAENISINGVDTPLDQQFNKQFPIPQVNIPDGVFDSEQGDVSVVVRYRAMDGKQYELTQPGKQVFRAGDERYNVEFPSPSSLKCIS